MNPPRIRSKSFQFAEPIELRDKWGFEVSLWTFDGETQIGDLLGTYGPFDTQELAITESRVAVRLACESVERSLGCEVSGKFLDMKNGGVLRSWEEN